MVLNHEGHEEHDAKAFFVMGCILEMHALDVGEYTNLEIANIHNLGVDMEKQMTILDVDIVFVLNHEGHEEHDAKASFLRGRCSFSQGL